MALSSGQLAVLVEVRRTGSLTRAALNLAVTPSAVSQQLARMEREVGSPLVTRGARGARLTTLGDTLADHGERVLAELARAEEAAAEFVGAHNRRVRVGAFPSASVALLSDAIASLRLRFSNSELYVVDLPGEAGTELVAKGDLDIALVTSYRAVEPRRDGIRFEHVLTEPMKLVVPDDHPVAKRNPVPFAELSQETWVSCPAQRPARLQLDDRAAQFGFVPRVAFETESYDVTQALVAAGVAIALVPRLALFHRARTVALDVEPALTRQIHAALPGRDDEVRLAGELLRLVRRVSKSIEAP